MPAIDAKGITDRVRTWANTMAGAERDPLLMCVVGAAKALSEALTKLDETPVSRRQIEQMIDSAIAEGLGNPAHKPEASHLRAVSHPGAICGPVRRVVWWNFAGHEPASPPFPWYRAELEALESGRLLPGEAVGCGPAHDRLLEQRRAGGEPRHPVRAACRDRWQRGREPSLLALAGAPFRGGREDGQLITVRAEDVHERETIRIAARTITRCQDVPKSLPEAREAWPLPPIAEILAEKVESPTSLETLATCHLKWLLSHVADLGAGRIRSIPDANRLFGNIAHAIAQEVFVPGPVPSGPQARKHAEQIFDRVVQQIAAPLLKPGGAGDLAFARERIPRALGTLAELLSKDGWEIIGTEMEVTHDFGNGLKVKGYTDLRVRHPVHDTGVIDLKWSRRDKRRRDEVKKGRAVQISTYGHAVEPGKSLPAAYFMLAQGSMLAEQASPLAKDPVKARQEPPGHVGCRRRHASVLERHGGSGTAAASGIKGAPVPPGLVMVPPKEPCEYCEYGSLCRIQQAN